jgi:anti-sigma regulatory factor (Ser/Thr protein kinase)
VRDTGRWRRTRKNPLRGFGLKLMQSLMDTITIDQRDDGTRIEMMLTPTTEPF